MDGWAEGLTDPGGPDDTGPWPASEAQAAPPEGRVQAAEHSCPVSSGPRWTLVGFVAWPAFNVLVYSGERAVSTRCLHLVLCQVHSDLKQLKSALRAGEFIFFPQKVFGR